MKQLNNKQGWRRKRTIGAVTHFYRIFGSGIRGHSCHIHSSFALSSA
jgi:hypothetical protein